MGTVGPLLAAAAAAHKKERVLEKLAFLKSPSRFDRTAQYLRRISSSPVNPYTIATRPAMSAVKKATRGGLGEMGGRAMKVGIGGLFAHEFITGMRTNMAATRKAMQIWGV